MLITKQDVHDKYSLDNLRSTVEELISMNCVPIINENDVVASPPDLDLDLAGVSTVLVNAQGGTLQIYGWVYAAGTLKTLAYMYTRPHSDEFCNLVLKLIYYVLKLMPVPDLLFSRTFVTIVAQAMLHVHVLYKGPKRVVLLQSAKK